MLEHIEAMLKGVMSSDARYDMIDHQHLFDTKTRLKFHLYDDEPMKVTYNDECVAVERDFTPSELKILNEVKLKVDDMVSHNARNELAKIYATPPVPA